MTLVLVDTFGFFFRSYFALPPLKSKSGFPTGLLTGFLNFVSKLVKEEPDALVLFCLEGRGKGFREDIYADYKGTRPDVPEELKQQLPIAIEWLGKMGFSSLGIEGFEADDVIATLAKRGAVQGVKVKIISHDKDLYQLIDDGRVVVWDPTKKIHIDTQACFEKFGVYPEDFIEFQSLVGDSVDNVPGVKGVGVKTAAKLIEQFKTLECIYANIDNVAGDKLRQNLLEHKERAFMSRELVRLRDDLEITADWSSFTVPAGDIFEPIREQMWMLDIRAVASKQQSLYPQKPILQPQPPKPSGGFEAVLLDTKEKLWGILDAIPNGAVVAIDTETDSLEVRTTGRLVGFSFAYEKEHGYYVPVAHNYLGVESQVGLPDALKALGRLLEMPFVGHNLKFDLTLVCRLLGRQIPLCVGDTMLMAWLLDPGSAVGLDSVAKRYLGHETIKFKHTVKEGQDFSAVLVEEACNYAAEDSWACFRLYEVLAQTAKEKAFDAMERILLEVELPFIAVLAQMEEVGVKISRDALLTVQTECDANILVLCESIYHVAGGQFNLNSTQQLAGVLFEKLGLSSGKKTKTGYSTDEATLAALADEHPIIPLMLEYRELYKLKSTYIEPLLKYAGADPKSRVHTSFLQTGTATGRLSSKNPNLQNIPARTQTARRIRSAFTADTGCVLVGLDYSQIELRLLAHFSRDVTLVEAFLRGDDIHLQTARKIFGDDAAVERRNTAKTINFGLLYGMGQQRLAQTLGISTKEAKTLIESYFASFPTVKGYLEGIKTQVKAQGYVETLIGRRRYFSFEGAGARDEASYLREAVNTVFQGSAADLIKLSMLRINEMIKSKNLEALLVLQIHDELIFEVKEERALELADMFATVMEGIYQLGVPLSTSKAIGRNWSELK